MKKTRSILTILAITFLGSVSIINFTQTTPVAAAGQCGGVDVSYLDKLCGGKSGGGAKKVEDSALWAILTNVLNIMLAGVGVLAIGGVVYGAILYASAQDNASQVEQAMTIFRNVVIGLVAFALMYSLLQFLIPGGVFAQITTIPVESIRSNQ